MVRLFCLLFSLFLVSCSPIQAVEDLGLYSTSLKGGYIFRGQGAEAEDYSQSRCRNYNASITGKDFESPDRDYGQLKLEYTAAVQEQIEFYTENSKGREFMRRSLERSTKYMPLMSHILRKGGLQAEYLVYAVLVESGFRCQIVSEKSGAVGCWQFLRKTATGPLLGDQRLAINKYVDARRDPELSTRAAVRYWQYLYNSVGPNWNLVLAGYNAGAAKIASLRPHTESRDFWELIKKPGLKLETKQYVPRIMAAITIARAPYEYGFNDLNFQPPLEFDLMKVNGRAYFREIADEHDYSHRELKELNPMFLTDFIPDSISYIRIPCRADVI